MNQAPEAPRLGGHLPELDGLRGLAILLVLIYHATLAFEPLSQLPAFVGQIVSFGWSGVDLFFVLSGFLITGVLIKAKDTPNYFTHFYARRCLRILPAYYIFLCIFFGIIAPLLVLHWLQDHQLWFWLHAANWLWFENGTFPDTWHINHLWSLAIEEQFYFIWPAVVLACSHRTLFRVCIGLFVLAFVARFSLIGLGMRPIPIYTGLITRLDTLAVGAMIRVCCADPELWRKAVRWHRPVFLISTLCLIVFLVLGHINFYYRSVQLYLYSINAVFFGCLLFAVIMPTRNNLYRRVLSKGAIRALGKHSYALYIYHWPVYVICMEFPPSRILWERPLPYELNRVFDLVLATVVSVGLALASWHLLEKRCLRFKRRFQATPTEP